MITEGRCTITNFLATRASLRPCDSWEICAFNLWFKLESLKETYLLGNEILGFFKEGAD